MSAQRNYGNYGAQKRVNFSRPRSSLSGQNRGANLQAVEYVPHAMEYHSHGPMECHSHGPTEHGHRLVPMVTNKDGPRGQGPVFRMNRNVYEGAEGQRITNETYEYQMANDGLSDQNFPVAMRNLFMMSPYQSSSKGVARANVRDFTEEEDEY